MSRGALYALSNAVFALLLTAMCVVNDVSNPRLLFICLLFAICTTPVVLARSLNGRYVILFAVLGMYFLLFGASDAATVILSAPPGESAGILSPAELVILTGGLLLVLGYQVAVVGRDASPEDGPARDWSTPTTLSMGIVLWLIGAGASWIWQVYRYRTATEVNAGFTEVGNLALVIARLVHPLGMLLLGYALAKTRSRPLLLLVLGAICIDVLIGFIGDTKELAMRGILLVIFARILFDGKLPRLWLAAGATFVMLAYPVFQAYRADVVGVRGLSRAQAAQDIGRSIALALESRSKIEEGTSGRYRTPSFLGRNNIKPTIETLVAKTGHEVKFQDGYTLGLFFVALVPRIMWPDKPSISVGQLFNRELHLADDPDVFISPSFVGDFYWNFGWGGIFGGMPLFGYLLGFVNRRCDMSRQPSVPRLLVLATTIYMFCVRLEDSVALEGIVWTRTLVAVGLMNLVFSRPQSTPKPDTQSAAGAPIPTTAPKPRFANLMR